MLWAPKCTVIETIGCCLVAHMMISLLAGFFIPLPLLMLSRYIHGQVSALPDQRR